MPRLLLLLYLAAGLEARDFRAGVARIDITPQESIWLSGYANRTKPSSGIVHKLWAKALAVEDGSRGKVVIVTTDLIGLPRAVSDIVAARVGKEYGLERSRLLLNSSHTHSGPVVRPNLMTMYELTAERKRALDVYAAKLTDDLVSVVGAAIGDLAPAKLAVGHGRATFGQNRRVLRNGQVTFGSDPDRPRDTDVPVISVRAPDGKLRAVLFGYACHNTTLGGDFYEVNGDYAGFAQIDLEGAIAGATALFLNLNSADQNPTPRGKVSDAERHGKTLSAEVQSVLNTSMAAVEPDLRTAWQSIQLPFAPHTREQFEAEAKDTNKYKVARAREMLRAYDERRPIRTATYPVQAVRLGKNVTIVALGGEVVVGYALRAKREYPNAGLIMAGYSNDVMCYIPTREVLGEGGYEAEGAMVYYGMPGRFTDDVEEIIFGSIYKVLARVGVKK